MHHIRFKNIDKYLKNYRMIYLLKNINMKID